MVDVYRVSCVACQCHAQVTMDGKPLFCSACGNILSDRLVTLKRDGEDLIKRER